MNLTQKLLLVIVSFGLGYFANSIISSNPDSSGWQTALRTLPDGTVIEGSKSELIDGLRKGYSLRVAWGWENGDKQLEHVADPIWTNIINENEVIINLDPQVLSRIDWEKEYAHYEDSALHNYEWRVVISTNGSFDAVWYNRATNEIYRRMPQTHLMSWMLEYPENRTEPAKPLFTTE